MIEIMFHLSYHAVVDEIINPGLLILLMRLHEEGMHFIAKIGFDLTF